MGIFYKIKVGIYLIRIKVIIHFLVVYTTKTGIIDHMFDRCLYFNANHLSRVVNKMMNDAYAPLGLSAAHSYLLRLVLKQPGLLQKEIGSILHLEKSTVTRFIDKMVEEGYLQRKPSVIDEVKYRHIFATGKAKHIESELESIGSSVYHQMTKTIKIDKFSEFVTDMIKITHKL